MTLILTSDSFISQLDTSKQHIAVIVSPLKTLMINQLQTLRTIGIRCASLSVYSEEEKDGA